VNTADLTSLLREHATMHSVPGAALGILRDGAATIAYYGVADVRTGEPVTSETRFSVGSLTKSMVATVIARLGEAGSLSMDDPIAKHVPELCSTGWAGQARVRDLLANRSGLPLLAQMEFGFDVHDDRDDGALARFAAKVDASVPAANFWSYTNVGWCLLGRVIETAAGVVWEDAMRRHLLEREGMSMTTFATSNAIPSRATGHDVGPHGPVPVQPLLARPYGPAGTTLVSTVTDLLRFAALHLDDPTLAQLRTAQERSVPIYGWLDSWCLGWARFDWEGGPVWGWDGLINGERSFLRIMPQRQAAIVLMTNASTGRALYRTLFPEVLEPAFNIRMPALGLEAWTNRLADLSRFAGVYAWPDRRVECTAAGSGLLVKTLRERKEATSLDGRTFLIDADDPDNPTITFDMFDDAGRPQVLYVMLWGLPRLDE
jgi:CubicO group peptidase (beta-lactamase class C family)